MSATTDQMNAAIAGIEATLVALRSHRASYEAGRSTAKNDRAAASGLARAEDIDNSISTAQLDRTIAARMVAEGLGPILQHAPASVGTLPASWVTAWQGKVTAIVP